MVRPSLRRPHADLFDRMLALGDLGWMVGCRENRTPASAT